MTPNPLRGEEMVEDIVADAFAKYFDENMPGSGRYAVEVAVRKVEQFTQRLRSHANALSIYAGVLEHGGNDKRAREMRDISTDILEAADVIAALKQPPAGGGGGRLLRQVLEAIETGRSEPLYIMRDAIRNHFEDQSALGPPNA